MKRQFKPGDRVRIRQWDDMEKEFGLDEDGDIMTPHETFVSYMKELCGQEATINEISDFDGIMRLEDDDGQDLGWVFTSDMLEPAEKSGQSDAWISVKDSLPKGECLAVGRNGSMLIGRVGWNEEQEWYDCSEGWTILDDVTHWKPLPEPPIKFVKEESK